MGNTTVGIVYLVGAGPGDPSLITLRGVECLRRAEVIVYDYLANPVVLQHAPAAAEKICLGRHGPNQRCSQEEIQTLLIQNALAGRVVVRLKGGDPTVFGHGAEEVEALRAAGIPYEMIPGVTAATAAAAYADIPITHGLHSSAVALVTGQERRGKQAGGLDYQILARFPGTLVFYMATASANTWSEALIRGGKPPDTPVAIVRRCSWNDQEVIRCTLGDVAMVIATRNVHPPTVVVVGHVVNLAPVVSWFAARPLFGKRILLTRPERQNASVADRLRELGAEVLVQPAIEITPPPDWQQVDQVLGVLERYDWIVFSSANGVRFFLDRLERLHGDVRRLGRTRIAAIGPGTADELSRYHLRADLVPDAFRAEALADCLVKAAEGENFLLIRASRGREVLAEQLAAAGKKVEQVVAYQSKDVAEPAPEVIEAMAAGKIDWVTVTSSAIAQSLARLFGETLRRTHLASISPVTSEKLAALGFPPAVEATRYTMDGLVEAILSASGRHP
jgi:uroporphyrinogen III methyltransferase/synthase